VYFFLPEPSPYICTPIPILSRQLYITFFDLLVRRVEGVNDVAIARRPSLTPRFFCEYLSFCSLSLPDSDSDPYPALRHLTVYRVLVTAPLLHGRLSRYHRKTDATTFFHNHTEHGGKGRTDATVFRTNFAMLLYLILPIPVSYPPSLPSDILLGFSPHLYPHHLAYGFDAVIGGR